MTWPGAVAAGRLAGSDGVRVPVLLWLAAAAVGLVGAAVGLWELTPGVGFGRMDDGG